MALADEMIKTIMENLNCDEETAKDVIECDKRIDKGEKLFDLPEDLEESAKKARIAGNCKGYTKPKENTRAEDRQKRFLIDTICNALNDHILGDCSIEITNPEREIKFEYCNRKFKIVLSCPRS